MARSSSQKERDTDLYFILDGKMQVSIKGRKQGERMNGNTVGEMAAIQTAQPRSATVKALGDCVVARWSGTDLERIANKYPNVWRQFARELARRLLERNRSVAKAREKIRVFVISSREAIDIVETIENAFASNDDIQIVAWKNDVFKVANYPLEDLCRSWSSPILRRPSHMRMIWQRFEKRLTRFHAIT